MIRSTSFWGIVLFCCTIGGPLLAQDIYSLSEVPEIRVYFEEANWAEQLVALKHAGEDERLPARVVINEETFEGAGVRHKGNSSFNNILKAGQSKLPYNIKVNYTNRRHKLPGGVTNLKLSNGFRDPTLLREVLAYEIAGRYMPCSRANFAKLYINDQYQGLYNLTESVDDELLERFYGNDDGILVKCDPIWGAPNLPNCPKGDKSSLQYLGPDTMCYRANYELKTDAGWAELADFTRVLNQEPDRLEEVLNIDQTLWMLVFNNLAVNLDSYTGRLCHNYYLYRDTFGIFQPIIWDMNLCFGGFRFTGLGQPVEVEELPAVSPFLHFKEQNKKRPLIVQLLKNSLWRKMYVAHFKTMLEREFLAERFEKRVRALHEEIRPLVAADSHFLYSTAVFEQNLEQSVRVHDSDIAGLLDLMQQRSEYLRNHPLMKLEGPSLEEVSPTVAGGMIQFAVSAPEAEQVWLFHKSGSYHPWKRIALQADASGSWTTELPTEKVQHYYLVAEGAKAATVYPERGSFDCLEVPLK